MQYDDGGDAQGQRWEQLQARVSPDEKRQIYLMCKATIGMPYSVITRLIWRRMLYNYRVMPQIRKDTASEINDAVDQVVDYIPVLRKQRGIDPRMM